MPSLTRIRPAFVVALVVTALALSACGSSAADSHASSAGRAPNVLKLQDPGNSGPLAYAKREGILEKRLARVGAKVEWGGTYASFTATIDAVRSGSINVLAGAVSPAIGYLANSDNIKIFSVTDPVLSRKAPDSDGLVVPHNSSIRSVRDLVGKRVAVNKAGKGEYLLLKALQQAHVPASKVTRVYLNPDQAGSAFATGRVDAWWAIVKAYPEAVSKGARVIVNGRDVDHDDAGIVAARTELLRQHPQTVRVYLDVLRELTEQAKKTPEKFENVFLTKGPTALSGPRLAVDVATLRYANVPQYATPADARYIEAVARVFRRYGVLGKDVAASRVIFDWSAVPGGSVSPSATASG